MVDEAGGAGVGADGADSVECFAEVAVDRGSRDGVDSLNLSRGPEVKLLNVIEDEGDRDLQEGGREGVRDRIRMRG